MAQPVILDTDLGYHTDPDDAIALAYVLLQPDCDLLGVTTVGLRSDWRAELAELICADLGRGDLPIVAGADRPIGDTQYWFENPVQPWPREAPDQPRRSYPPNRALDWLSQTIRQAPGEITLITIGQFTNLATLLLADPEAAAMLKRVVSMGGRLQYPPDQPKGECNVILDPLAAKIAFQRLGDALTLVPIDVVRGKPLTADMLQTMLRPDAFQTVRAAAHGWQSSKGNRNIGLADPATVAFAFDPSLGRCQTGRLDVELYPHPLPAGDPFPAGQLTGATTFTPDPAGPHRVLAELDPDPAHAHIQSIFAYADS